MVEINTIFKFLDKDIAAHLKLYTTVVKIDDDVKEKKEMEKIILVDVQTKIYPDLEKSLLNLLHNSGYVGINFDKKVDFEDLYKKKFN